MAEKKKVLFSGMQATGSLHVGNYLGALRNWLTLSDEYECFYSVVDLHSITIRQDPAVLRKSSRDVLMLYIAAGLDPDKCCIYYQSHVPAHTELAWILGCFTYIGELNRMSQFKDKTAKNLSNINSGLHTYPVLQAADILLFQADAVPVGRDQVQHLELCRDIAERFNMIYGDVFTIPAAWLGKTAAKVMSLQDPGKKMSKSDENVNACIFVRDERDVIIKKCKRAVTDSLMQVKYDKENQPGVSNLIDIYSACTGKNTDEIEAEFAGGGYKELKIAVGETVADTFEPIKKRFAELESDKAYVDGIIKENAARAALVANQTLQTVKEKIGFP
ncbi:MAG: tryptophan--tRNA ligase [Lachnospiraceae bacterium]|jgi:tryptophanyl-tRNA synthetase|nr:tryptophan--tRNA ligase [Lachnospiraceae bacterium]